MATSKLYLDTRKAQPGIPSPVKISVCLNGRTALHFTGVRVLPEQWDTKTGQVTRHPQKQYLNTMLASQKQKWDFALLEMTESGAVARCRTVAELKASILRKIYPESPAGKRGVFVERFRKFGESRRTAGARSVYSQTLRRLEAFDPGLQSRSFEDIDKDYLFRFEYFLATTAKSANARAIHFRNIRAVFNDAIDDGVTSCYPFRKFKIRTQPTAKRSLTVEQLRQLMDYPCEPYQTQYRDLFVLMFYLCGINAVDLFNAPPDAIVNGRLEYVRAKTHKPYSVKVEPEAMEIIDRYRGEKHLLSVLDGRSSYMDYLRRMDRALKDIGPVERHGLGGKKTVSPLFPRLSQYWCRHTWATIAAELDVPKETIAAGLGHGGNSVTDIYINFNEAKVDAANRRIIDFVLHGIR